MHDLKFIRSHPDLFDAALKKRNKPEESIEILALDSEHRQSLTVLQEHQMMRKLLSKQFGDAKKAGKETAELATKAETLREIIKKEEEKAEQLHQALQHKLSLIQNMIADEVPFGQSEDQNIIIETWGTPPSFDFDPLSHEVLGEALGLMNFERAAKLSGSRFVVLYGALARLERALAAFMIDVHAKEFGFEEVYPPYLVHEETVYGTAHLPKSHEDMFRTTTNHWLLPTAEVALTSLVAGEICEEDALPLRYVAYTPCFRSEAGSAGRDTRGLIRQHQFGKVELVSITTPETSEAEHERILQAAETVLQRLGLAYRKALLCSGDTGFAAQKTYDLEVWLPGHEIIDSSSKILKGAYREISSCSNCGDFQARRMNARYRPHAKEDKGPLPFVHTLNGSGVAVGRALLAILENYQQKDGSIALPPILYPYMGGMEKIEMK